MEWIDAGDRTPQLPPEQLVALLREAAALPDGAPDALLRLGRALRETGDTPGAIDALTRFTAIRSDNADAWRLLASLYLESEDYAAALWASKRGGAVILHARALIRLERTHEAEHLLRDTLALDVHPAAFERLARLLAQQCRGKAMLDLCDERAGLPGCATIGLAFRAVALVLVGRDEEALQLVDPDRHVMQVAFASPDDFNAELAAQILHDQRPTVREGLAIGYEPDPRRVPHLSALFAFIRRALETYVAELPERGLGQWMSAPPARVRLHSGCTVLRLNGHHGEHFHPRGYVSCVYHVSVPTELSSADGVSGQLAIGTCGSLTAKMMPWRTRYVRPRPGMLTIFPSHFFHDVVPTGIAAPRVSVAADMEPVT